MSANSGVYVVSVGWSYSGTAGHVSESKSVEHMCVCSSSNFIIEENNSLLQLGWLAELLTFF